MSPTTTLRDDPAFGYRPDARCATAGTPEAPVPASVRDVVDSDAVIDLTPWAPVAHYQGSLGSCSAHGGAGASEGLMAMAARDGLWGGPQFTLSRLALYQTTLDLAGHRGRDDGASAAEVCRALARGFPDDARWPYSEDLPYDLPPRNVFTSRRLVDWRPLAHTRAALRAALALSCPILIGVPVFDGEGGMASAHAFDTGEVREPAPGDTITGWHLVSVWRHDPVAATFTFQQSWRGWGPDRETCLGTLPETFVLGRANEIVALGAVR